MPNSFTGQGIKQGKEKSKKKENITSNTLNYKPRWILKGFIHQKIGRINVKQFLCVSMLNAETMTAKEKKPSQYSGVQTQATLKDYTFYQLQGNLFMS